MEDNSILFDSQNPEETQYGEFNGSFIIKMKNQTLMLIFSEEIIIDRIEENVIHKITALGLNLGIAKNFAYSKELANEFLDISHIDYIIKIPNEVVSEFDSARFSGVYPNIIRFLHTACLYIKNIPNEKDVNHLSLMKGEILNRPVAISDNLVIISDRMVVDEINNPIFYDSIIIKREEIEEGGKTFITINYDPFGNFNLEQFKVIFLLGSENF